MSAMRQPRWWALVVLLVFIVAATVQLGRWQYGRWEDRRQQAEAVRASEASVPRPLAEVAGADPAEVRFAPVRVVGEYQDDATVLIRNRPLDGRNGYLVVVPLLSDTGTVAVNRGWIPAGRTAAAPETVPAAPTGSVEVLGRVQPDELARTAPDLPEGQALALSSAVVAADAFPGAYLDLIAETPQVEPAPIPPAEPGTGTGPHLIYAVQWWLFGVVAVVGFVILTRREVTGSADPHSESPV